MKSLDRPAWNALCDGFRDDRAPEITSEVQLSGDRATVEFRDDDGYTFSHTSIYAERNATDIRTGRLQFLVGYNRLAVIRQVGPYPIKQWDVLYDGDLKGNE